MNLNLIEKLLLIFISSFPKNFEAFLDKSGFIQNISLPNSYPQVEKIFSIGNGDNVLNDEKELPENNAFRSQTEKNETSGIIPRAKEFKHVHMKETEVVLSNKVEYVDHEAPAVENKVYKVDDMEFEPKIEEIKEQVIEPIIEDTKVDEKKTEGESEVNVEPLVATSDFTQTENLNLPNPEKENQLIGEEKKVAEINSEAKPIEVNNEPFVNMLETYADKSEFVQSYTEDENNETNNKSSTRNINELLPYKLMKNSLEIKNLLQNKRSSQIRKKKNDVEIKSAVEVKSEE